MDVEKYIMKVDTSIQLDSVILTDENKEKVKEFIKEIGHARKLASFGLQPMNRLLFYGASGTGKTYLGKALSNHLNYKLLYVDVAKSLTDGNVAQNLSAIFEIANTGKYMIFIDECDSIAWSRDAENAESGNVRRATNSLFQQMDQMNPDVVVICATNMLKRLDPAFERRFNMKLEFRRPDVNIDDAIKHFLFTGFNIIDDADITVKDIISRRAGQYSKLSYYELKGLVERAMKRAVINDTKDIKTSEIYKDLAIAMNVKLQFKTDEDLE